MEKGAANIPLSAIFRLAGIRTHDSPAVKRKQEKNAPGGNRPYTPGKNVAVGTFQTKEISCSHLQKILIPKADTFGGVVSPENAKPA